ncbi:hypothetical protein Scep_008939 [Stephania cephalantha]|uniref:Two-component response regulator n=1 Tax=Stephania cephalantha TaxID=152367 RepID=A0AAP0JS87_9MAGN
MEDVIGVAASSASRKVYNNASSDDQIPEGLRVLVVDDDPTFLFTVEKMLKMWNYEVTTCTDSTVALSMLRENKGGFQIVMCDVHMPVMNGYKLLECISDLEMKIPVISYMNIFDLVVSADDKKDSVMKGIKHGACDYLIKPLHPEVIKHIWRYVVVKWKNSELEEFERSGNAMDANRRTAEDAVSDESWRSSKRRKEEEEEAEDRDVDTSALKKPRVVWSENLHKQFVAAVNQLGIDKAVPKKILELMELMNVSGLTRENVASHLQKYRLYLKRRDGGSTQHHIGLNSPYMCPQEASFGHSSFDNLDIPSLAIPERDFVMPSAAIGRGMVTLGDPSDADLVLHGHPTAIHHLPAEFLGASSPSGLDAMHCMGSTSVMMERVLQSRLRGQSLSGTGIQSPMGQLVHPNDIAGQVFERNLSVVNGRNAGYHSSPQSSSLVDYQMDEIVDLPGNAFPLSTPADLPILQSTDVFVDGGRLEVKDPRGFTTSFETFSRLHQCRRQGYHEFKNVDLTFEASQHSNAVPQNVHCLPPVLSHQGFAYNEMMGEIRNVFNANKSTFRAENQLGTTRASSMRLTAGGIPEASCDNMVFAKHVDQDVPMNIFKQQHGRVEADDNEFDYDDYPSDDNHV